MYARAESGLWVPERVEREQREARLELIEQTHDLLRGPKDEELQEMAVASLPRRRSILGDTLREKLLRRMRGNPDFKRVIRMLDLAEAEAIGYPLAAMDGPFYRDIRDGGWFTAAAAQVTGTTEVLLFPYTFVQLPGHYFNRPGKTLTSTMWGKATTTTGTNNITITARYGTTTAGTSLGATTATAMTASITNASWKFEQIGQLYTVGATGTIQVFGKLDMNESILAARQFLPATAPATTTIDTTTNPSGFLTTITLSNSASNLATIMLLTIEAIG